MHLPSPSVSLPLTWLGQGPFRLSADCRLDLPQTPMQPDTSSQVWCMCRRKWCELVVRDQAVGRGISLVSVGTASLDKTSSCCMHRIANFPSLELDCEIAFSSHMGNLRIGNCYPAQQHGRRSAKQRELVPAPVQLGPESDR